jgi:membrane-bound lytic murein transglycosylase B
MATTSPRIQVTVDPELAAVLSEFGDGAPRSRTVRDLAIRGAEALREERQRREEAIEFLRRIDSGEDDRFDFSVSAALHAARR